MLVDQKLRVLVVDDSIVFRRALSRAFGELPEVELVGTACDGGEALQKIKSLRPDLVTLDLEMPGMDGLTTLRAMRDQGLSNRVVVLSATGGERRTVEALCLGADDFIQKPSSSDAMSNLRQLLHKAVQQFYPGRGAAVARARSSAMQARPCREIELVVVGVSTGGPNALPEMLAPLPANLRVPMLIVQHMPATFTRLLAERLNSKCAISISEAIDQEPLKAGQVYIAPGDYHMEVTGSLKVPRIHLQQGPHENGCRPAADVLFRSAAKLYGNRCLSVVMTGMGKDGLQGVRALAAQGALCLAQDQQSCAVYGMPRFIVENRLAQEVLPPAELGRRIAELVNQKGT
ncbi:chemotaxis-specific protein-glutamate methyltransferase CheB [bacterium]|nr:chemotaxis-specific protein-glutamate methyltransferase CheB [bacterium]